MLDNDRNFLVPLREPPYHAIRCGLASGTRLVATLWQSRNHVKIDVTNSGLATLSEQQLKDQCGDRSGQPIVSVVIPTYNRANVLARSIKSVLAQTYSDFEVIVVDDHSTDGTEELVRSFKDPRIRYIRHKENRGAAAARNSGIRIARGEYIAFQDSDTEWFPQKLERQMALFKGDLQGNLGLVTSDHVRVEPSGEVRCCPLMSTATFEGLLNFGGGAATSCVSLVVRRVSAKSELYFDETLPALQDWDLVFRLSPITRFDYVPEALHRSYRCDGPNVHSSSNVIRAHVAIVQKYSEELRARPKLLNRHHETIAMNYFEQGDMSSARRHFKAAIRAYPRRPFDYAAFAACFMGHRWFGLCFKIYVTIRVSVLKGLGSRLRRGTRQIENGFGRRKRIINEQPDRSSSA